MLDAGHENIGAMRGRWGGPGVVAAESQMIPAGLPARMVSRRKRVNHRHFNVGLLLVMIAANRVMHSWYGIYHLRRVELYLGTGRFSINIRAEH